MDIDEIVRGLSEDQRARLIAADPRDINHFHYAPFEGAAMGLFQIAPGWQRMELSPTGLAVRAALQGEP